MNGNLFINPRAVLFHDYLDKRNGYHTVVCNTKTETYLKVNPSGYKILRAIDENPGISTVEISEITGIKEESIKKFIVRMAKENVVFVK